LGLVLVWAECLEYISDTGAQFARHASVKDALSLSLLPWVRAAPQWLLGGRVSLENKHAKKQPAPHPLRMLIFLSRITTF
jgi:hypothetical protein